MSKKIKQVTEQVYYPETIPDKTEELIKLSREADQREHQEILEDKRRREDAKNARILTSKVDKYVHAINTMIEFTEAAKSPLSIENKNDPNRCTVPYFYFNFENRLDTRLLFDSFLSELREAGCFKSYNRWATYWDLNYTFDEIDIGKLIKLRKKQILKIIAGQTNTSQNFLLFVSKRERKRIVSQIIEQVKLAKLERELVHALGDGESHKLKELSKILSTKALEETKSRAIEKLKAVGWTIRSTKLISGSFYQLDKI